MGIERRSSRRRLIYLGQIVLFITAFVAAGLVCPSVFPVEEEHTRIFVIDSSENIAPYLPAIKEAILTVADQTEEGNTLGIISFSDYATRIIVRKIADPRDNKTVMSRLDAIEAQGKVGDVSTGVVRALHEVTQLGRKGNRNRKGIIVISSSRSPDEPAVAERLEKGLAELTQQMDETEWYIQYCYLNGVVDDAVEAFVSSNSGISYDVDALAAQQYGEPVEELFRIFVNPLEIEPPILDDISGAILGKAEDSEKWAPLKVYAEIPEKMHVRVASNSRAVISLQNLGKLGLAPETHLMFVEAKVNPLTRESHISVELEAGSVWTSLSPDSPSVLTLAAGKMRMEPSGEGGEARFFDERDELVLTSFAQAFSARFPEKPDEALTLRRNQSIRIVHGNVVGEVMPAEPNLIEKWKSWRRALFDNIPLSALNFTVPEIMFPEESVMLGPIKSGEVLTREFALQISGVDDLAKLKIDVDISLDLPDGLVLSTGVIGGEMPDSKILTLRTDGNSGFRSRRSETHAGVLWLSPAPQSRAVFDKIMIPITVVTKGPLVPTWILLAAAGAVLAVVVILATGKVIRKTSTIISRPHGVIGRLIVINDPTGGRIGTINLEELSTKSSRLSLVVGRDRAAEVRLRHASVNPMHCVLEAYLVGGRLESHIEPVESAKVIVDGERIRSKMRLRDGARIEIGEFECQFEDTQMYKKVEIVRRNGKRLFGILDTSGMDAEGFRLSPMDAVSPSERARVKFSEIRYAIFYRRIVDILSGTPRPMPKPDTMKRVELMFKKGNTISGYIHREYVEGRRRYVELLPLETGSDIDYTIVDYSAVVEKKTL